MLFNIAHIFSVQHQKAGSGPGYEIIFKHIRAFGPRKISTEDIGPTAGLNPPYVCQTITLFGNCYTSPVQSMCCRKNGNETSGMGSCFGVQR